MWSYYQTTNRRTNPPGWKLLITSSSTTKERESFHRTLNHHSLPLKTQVTPAKRFDDLGAKSPHVTLVKMRHFDGGINSREDTSTGFHRWVTSGSWDSGFVGLVQEFRTTRSTRVIFFQRSREIYGTWRKFHLKIPVFIDKASVFKLWGDGVWLFGTFFWGRGNGWHHYEKGGSRGLPQFRKNKEVPIIHSLHIVHKNENHEIRKVSFYCWWFLDSLAELFYIYIYIHTFFCLDVLLLAELLATLSWTSEVTIRKLNRGGRKCVTE